MRFRRELLLILAFSPLIFQEMPIIIKFQKNEIGRGTYWGCPSQSCRCPRRIFSILCLSSDVVPPKERPNVLAISMTSSALIMSVSWSSCILNVLHLAEISFSILFFSSFLLLFASWTSFKWAGMTSSKPGGNKGLEQEEDPIVSEDVSWYLDGLMRGPNLLEVRIGDKGTRGLDLVWAGGELC